MSTGPGLYSRMEKGFLGAALLVALLLIAVLFTSGFEVSLFGSSFALNNVALTVISFLLLVLASRFVKYELHFRDALQSNEALVLFCLSLICYLANQKTLAVGDTLPNRYLPFSVIREGNFDFDELHFLYAHGIPYWLRQAGQHYVSYYPVGAALLSLPIFFISAVGPVDPQSKFPEQLEKLSAAGLTALSVVLVLLMLRRVVDRKTALLLAAIYAFGTSCLSSSSQALWQHGPSQLCLAAALYCLVRGKDDPRWIAPAAGALAFSIVCRPTDLLVAIPLCVYVAVHHFKTLPRFILFGLPPALFQLWYNLTYFGQWVIGQTDLAASHNWQGPVAANLAGLLFSPARGLFVYSPVFLFLIPAVVQIWKNNAHLLLRYLSIGALACLLTYSKWGFWTGGYCFGPRFLSDLFPAFVLMLTPIMPMVAGSRGMRIVMIALFGLSVAAHSVGTFFDDRYWNVYLGANERLVWSWTDNQLVNPMRRLAIRARVRFKDIPEASEAPELISIAYDSSLQEPIECKHDRVFYFDVGITNTGRAACLTWPVTQSGCTQLGWHWQKGGKDLLRTRQILRLKNDLLPGDRQVYTVSMTAPEKPGRYVLVIELVAKDIGRFSALGIPPLRVEAIVN